MKKEEFLKLGVSEEIAVKCESASAEELKGYIPKTRFNEVNEENKSLKATIDERDKQLTELKKASGDSEALKKKIEELEAANSEQKIAHEAEMNKLKLDNAVDSALAIAGAKNGKAVRALLKLENIKLGDDGKLVGFEEQLSEIRKSDAYLFNENDQQTKPDFKGFQPGAAGDVKLGAKVDTSKMSYAELCAYLEQNPDANLTT